MSKAFARCRAAAWPRTARLTLLVCPLLSALTACGEGQGSGSANGSGTGGVPGSGGSAANEPNGGEGGSIAGTTGEAGADAGGTAETIGAAGTGGGTQGGFPGIDAFTRVTLRSQGSYLDEATGECGSTQGYEEDAIWSIWSFDRASKMFTWEYCKGYPGTFERSGRTLSDAEAQAIVNTVSLMTLGVEGDCIVTGGGGEIHIEVDGATTVYRPDWGWCGGENDETYVDGSNSLWFWLESLTDPPVIPDTPETLELYTGEIPDGPFPNAECSENPRPVEYLLDVATRTLTWRGSSSPPNGGGIQFCPAEMRVLEQQELDSVLAAYGALERGVSAPCSALARPSALDRPGGQIPWIQLGLDEFIDESASCHSETSREFTIGVSELTHVVADLTK
jgi:hypothetical protein